MSKKYPGGFVTNLGTFGNSVFFDGTGDYLSVPTGTALSLTGDYTIEAWVYVTAQPSASFSAIFSNGDFPATAQVILALNTSGAGVAPNLYVSNGSGWSINLVGSQQINLNTWTHVAVTCSGSTFTLWTNGVSSGTATYSGTRATPAATSVIGRLYVSSDLYYVTGNISNLRVVKGTALYTSAFPPPNQLLNVPNTSLLTCNSPLIVDQSSSALAITVNGNTAVSTFTPFPVFNPAPTSFSPLTPAPGVWTLDQALQYTQQGVWPSYAVNAIEDVFSTYLYTGNGSTQTITNGIDLSGKGGMVWVKARNFSNNHAVADTARGTGKIVLPNLTNGQLTNAVYLPAFNSNGFNVEDGGGDVFNASTYNYVSWTFRKQAKFFDIVTYTGNGTARTIAHNLGSTPGCVIVKRTDSTSDWSVYHRGLTSASQNIYLNLTNAAATASSIWNSTAPTSTEFSVGTATAVNANGGTYVAYLFAHDAGGFGSSGTDNVITCGSYTGNGSTTGPTITLGYEPQWILVKRAVGGTAGWILHDTMRGLPTGGNSNYLQANASDAETGPANYVDVNATGFQLKTTGASWNASGSTYIYIAIRRGPMRPPSTGTSVFNLATATEPSSSPLLAPGTPPPDTVWHRPRLTEAQTVSFADRLRGNNLILGSANTSAEQSSPGNIVPPWNFTSGQSAQIAAGAYYNNSTSFLYAAYSLVRAPGFFDVVCYTGNGVSPQTITHNLGVTPEMFVYRQRAGGQWWLYHSGLPSPAINQYVRLNTTDASANAGIPVFGVSSTTFTVTDTLGGTTNTQPYICYLFATVPGVSKVGSYTGTGTTQVINCGFTAGSRFVMIKRADSTGDWYVWDSARGIVAGNDPYFLMNSTAVQVTNTDYVDTANSGFEISSTAPAAINANGGTFIFLAIA